MSLWSSLWTGVGIARESSAAVNAARQVLAEGRTVADALDAFCAATSTPIDDTVAKDLHVAAEQALHYLGLGASMLGHFAGWMEEHGEAVEQGSERVLDVVSQLPALTRQLVRVATDNGAALVKMSVKLDAMARRTP